MLNGVHVLLNMMLWHCAGGRVILACRDLEKAEQARAEIVLETANRNVVVKLLDLASLGSIRAFVKDINACKTLPFSFLLLLIIVSASSTCYPLSLKK